MEDTISKLRDHILARLAPGSVSPDQDLLQLLERYWQVSEVEFGTKMAPYKAGRIEELSWHPPVLEFRITRHPGPWFRNQRWSFDFQTGRATHIREWGERKNQSYTKEQRKAEAEEIAEAVRNGQPHPAVRYDGETITIYLARLPSTRPQAYVLPKRTAQGRQKALKEELASLFAAVQGLERNHEREQRSTLVCRRSSAR